MVFYPEFTKRAGQTRRSTIPRPSAAPSLGFVLGLLLLPVSFSPSFAACDRTASNASTLTTEFSAATPGQTICLATGSYGTFSGGSKSGLVTLTAAPGATASMGIGFANKSNFVLDGLTITGGMISGTSHDITIRNSTFTGSVTFSNLANSNILFDHNTHNTINGGGQFVAPARLHLSYGSSTHSGVTIQNSLMDGGSADGVQTGVGVNIINNEFRGIREGSCSDCHTDAIQLLGAKGSVIRGNYIHDCASGIVAYDAIEEATIENNVVDLGGRPWGIELYADLNSVVRHNTLPYRANCDYNQPCGQILLDHKTADPAGRGTVLVDNIATSIGTNNGSTAATRHHNLVRSGAVSGDLTGSPTYTGGAISSTWAGWALTSSSLGKGTASDGLNIGATTFGSTTPPPSGSACDINSDSSTTVTDVQLCANQAIGTTVCGTGDINKDGSCSVVDVQRVVNAALGGSCVTP